MDVLKYRIEIIEFPRGTYFQVRMHIQNSKSEKSQ